MNEPELEALLEALDEALVKAFPGPELMSVLVVGGACLLFEEVTTRPTEDVDVIINPPRKTPGLRHGDRRGIPFSGLGKRGDPLDIVARWWYNDTMKKTTTHEVKLTV